jgi:hypothetical protein
MLKGLVVPPHFSAEAQPGRSKRADLPELSSSLAVLRGMAECAFKVPRRRC